MKIARTWDELPPVVTDGIEHISTRVLEKRSRDMESALLIIIEMVSSWAPDPRNAYLISIAKAATKK